MRLVRPGLAAWRHHMARDMSRLRSGFVHGRMKNAGHVGRRGRRGRRLDRQRVRWLAGSVIHTAPGRLALTTR